jgi:surface polysaccharide O-acyltransferase-like enzyme
MNKKTIAKPPARFFHLDNLKIYLTILVIFHHTAIVYGNLGDWGDFMVRDPAVDEISPIFLTLFNVINQSYFMSGFFLLAGYFTPRSFERKGGWAYIRDRLIRLGIPVLLYNTIIFNINVYLADRFIRHVPFSPRLIYTPGHLWFLQALLIFAVIYVVYRAIADRNSSRKFFQYYQDRFPPNTTLVLSVIFLAILTFVVRLWFPVGSWVAGFQLGHFPHYIFSFFVGILAQRGDWFTRLNQRQARRWGLTALLAIPFLFVLIILGGVLENEANLVKYLGGFHWQAIIYALWETFLFIGITVFLLNFFRERFGKSGSLARTMAENVYTVYIIHLTVLSGVSLLFLSINIPSILKFFIVGTITVLICFLLSVLIRKIPGAKRVLG